MIDEIDRASAPSPKVVAFRIVKPVFLGNPFHCVARDDNRTATLQTLDAVHDTCTSATAE